MNIESFFEKSAGKWFSQRTSYQLGQTEQWHQSDKTNVFQEVVPGNSDDVIELCDRYHIDPALAIVGLLSRWEKTYFKPAGSCLLVAFQPDTSEAADATSTGKDEPQNCLMLQTGKNGPIRDSRYHWGSDETLVIQTQLEQGAVEERLWYAADNLRLRTTLMDYPHMGLQVSSFYSEIRMGVAVPASDDA